MVSLLKMDIYMDPPDRWEHMLSRGDLGAFGRTSKRFFPAGLTQFICMMFCLLRAAGMQAVCSWNEDPVQLVCRPSATRMQALRS